MELIKHGKGGAYFYYRGCTVYFDYRDDCIDGQCHRLAVEDNITAKHYYVYLLKGKIELSDCDKFMLADRDRFEPYIVREDGSVINFSEDAQKQLFQYHYDNAHNWPWVKKFINEQIAAGHSAQECEEMTVMHYINQFLDLNINYYGAFLRLTKFYDRPCLWIDSEPSNRFLPHMQFVGGYPTEWCAFIDEFTDEDFSHIYQWNGEPVTKQELLEWAEGC